MTVRPSKDMVMSVLVNVTVQPKLHTADSENRLFDNTLSGNMCALTINAGVRASLTVPMELITWLLGSCTVRTGDSRLMLSRLLSDSRTRKSVVPESAILFMTVLLKNSVGIESFAREFVKLQTPRRSDAISPIPHA